jgi:hypothetical protein
MVTIGQIAIDGTKVKAVASNDNVITRDELAVGLQKIETQINQIFNEAEAIDNQEDKAFGPACTGEELPPELQQAQQRQPQIQELMAQLDEQGVTKMNPAEPEARFMRQHGRHELGYNAPVATENQVVLTCHLNNDQNDLDQAPPSSMRPKRWPVRFWRKKNSRWKRSKSPWMRVMTPAKPSNGWHKPTLRGMSPII